MIAVLLAVAAIFVVACAATAEVGVALKCDLTAVETDMFASQSVNREWVEYQMVDGLAVARSLADSSGYLGFATREKVEKLIAQDFIGYDVRVQKFSLMLGDHQSIRPSNIRGLYFIAVIPAEKMALLVPVTFNTFGMAMHRPDGSRWNNGARFRWTMTDDDFNPWSSARTE